MGQTGLLRRSLSIAKLGAEMMRAKGGGDTERRAALAHGVARRMASLHGLPQKIGQLVGLFSHDEEVSAELAVLSSRGETVSSDEFKRWLIAGVGADRAKEFVEIDPNGFGASIGQVHRARLANGAMVAVKIQYPSLRDALAVDLKLLDVVSIPLRIKRESKKLVSYDVEAYRDELGRALHEELDYCAERETLTRMHARAAEIPCLIVPAPIPELCSDTVLTMEWIDGVALDRLRSSPPSLRAVVARTLLQLFLRGWLRWGEVHADPHPGNFRIQILGDRVRVGVLDFGCMKRVSGHERAAAREILTAPPSDPKRALALCAALGFSADLLSPMRMKLPRLLAELTRPFTKGGEFDLETWRLAERMTDILGDDRWNFRLAGPPALTFILRAFAGLCTHLRGLAVAVDWQRELASVISEPTPLPRTPLEFTEILEADSVLLSVRVFEGGRAKVEVTLPGRSVENLSEVIPPEVRAVIEGRGIDLDSIAREARDRGLAAGELFSVREGEREVRVSLIESP